eukprot:10335722-Lingulodinium_polyedra.AAC.1
MLAGGVSGRWSPRPRLSPHSGPRPSARRRTARRRKQQAWIAWYFVGPSTGRAARQRGPHPQ